MPLLLVLAIVLISTTFLQTAGIAGDVADDIADDIVDEWDEKEISIQEHNNGEYAAGSLVKEKKVPPRYQSIKKTPINKKTGKKNNVSKKQVIQKSSPITRPILYRYIYVNPRAEKLKAEARKKREAQKKAASE